MDSAVALPDSQVGMAVLQRRLFCPLDFGRAGFFFCSRRSSRDSCARCKRSKRARASDLLKCRTRGRPAMPSRPVHSSRRPDVASTSCTDHIRDTSPRQPVHDLAVRCVGSIRSGADVHEAVRCVRSAAAHCSCRNACSFLHSSRRGHATPSVRTAVNGMNFPRVVKMLPDCAWVFLRTIKLRHIRPRSLHRLPNSLGIRCLPILLFREWSAAMAAAGRHRFCPERSAWRSSNLVRRESHCRIPSAAFMLI